MPDLTALPAMPGGKPKQAPPPLQPVPAPASVEPAGPAPDQAPLGSSAAAGAPASALLWDNGSAAAPIEGHGSLRPEPGLGTGAAVTAARRSADVGPAPNGAESHAGVPAPHAGSSVRAGQQVCGLHTCARATPHICCAIAWLTVWQRISPEPTNCAERLMCKVASWFKLVLQVAFKQAKHDGMCAMRQRPASPAGVAANGHIQAPRAPAQQATAKARVRGCAGSVRTARPSMTALST